MVYIKGWFYYHIIGKILKKNNFLSFVSCVSDKAVFARYLKSSPCLMNNQYPLKVYEGMTSAAQAFNIELKRSDCSEWLVSVHQDVFLPPDWDGKFIRAIIEAQEKFSKLAVVGLYGVLREGENVYDAGHVLDRGELLEGSDALPCAVQSVDEFLFAVRVDSGLKLDPELGFDFYGTDVVLTAIDNGFEAVVVDAYCEHWSRMPRLKIPVAVLERIMASGAVFERKWRHKMPLNTPCFSISQVGDVASLCHAHNSDF